MRATSSGPNFVRALQFADGTHRRLRRDVAGKHLEPDVQTVPARAEPFDQKRRIAAFGIDVEVTEFAFEHDVGTLEVARGEIGGSDPALGSAPHMQAFHHAAIAGFGEGQEA